MKLRVGTYLLKPLSIIGLVAACAGVSTPSQAFVLTSTSTCYPGAKWVTGSAVKVKLLSDSLTDYVADNKLSSGLTIAAKAIADIQAVVDEYNAVAGSTLKLEYAGGIVGDNNLEEYDADQFDAHTIVVGFSDLAASSNESAPAWTPHNPDDSCTFARRHILFRKDTLWTFGAPATTDVNGKYFDGGTSFRAVLLHEMGHAIGFSHETDAYAVMDHGIKAWTRGANEVPQMELLPDDINGVLALYGFGATGQLTLDVSVTNTWFFTAEERTQYNAANDIRHPGCDSTETSIDQLLEVIPDLQGPGLLAAQGQLQRLQTDLYECRYREDEAAQLQNCKVSSRGDIYAEPGKEEVLCGVNTAGSSREAVSATVCPGDQLQLRYTVNNKSRRSVRLQEQVWLSADDDLEVSGPAADIQSPDVRTFDLNSARSESIGRVYKVPASTPVGTTYRVYVRIVPLDPSTGNSLWSSDVDQWNNSIRVRGSITASCPPKSS